MMIKTKSIATLIAAIGIVSMLSLGASSLTSHVMAAASEQKFTAKMSGKEEVPPNDSSATGWAWVKAMNETVGFKVHVTDIDKATAAHIHFGTAGKNGPIVVTLFKSDKPTELKNSTLGEGNVTATDLEGPLKGKAISDLIAAMKNGTTYVNVHSTDFPDGEMRGQLMANSTG